MYLIHRYDGRLLNRVSIRLFVTISLIDGVRGIISLPPAPLADGNACFYLGLFNNLSNLTHTSLTMMILLNYQLILIDNYPRKGWWEPVYYLFGLGLPGVISGFLGITDSFGYNDHWQQCRFKQGTPHVAIYLTSIIPSLTAYCFNLVTGYRLLIRLTNPNFLYSISPSTPTTMPMDGRRKPLQSTTIKLLLVRVQLYTLLPILLFSCQVIGLVMELGLRSNGLPASMVLANQILPNSSGLFNLLGFLCDPALRTSLHIIRREFKNQEEEDYLIDTQHHNLPSPFHKQCLNLILNYVTPRLYPLPSQFDEGMGISPESYQTQTDSPYYIRPKLITPPPSPLILPNPPSKTQFQSSISRSMPYAAALESATLPNLLYKELNYSTSTSTTALLFDIDEESTCSQSLPNQYQLTIDVDRARSSYIAPLKRTRSTGTNHKRFNPSYFRYLQSL